MGSTIFPSRIPLRKSNATALISLYAILRFKLIFCEDLKILRHLLYRGIFDNDLLNVNVQACSFFVLPCRDSYFKMGICKQGR